MARAPLQTKISYSYLFKRTIWFLWPLNAMMSCLVAFLFWTTFFFKRLSNRHCICTTRIREKKRREKVNNFFSVYFHPRDLNYYYSNGWTYIKLRRVYLCWKKKSIPLCVAQSFFDSCRSNDRDTHKRLLDVCATWSEAYENKWKANDDEATTQSELMNILC